MTTHSWKNLYTPADSNLWRGRDDGPHGPRFHQIVRCAELSSLPAKADQDMQVAIIGFACDVGVSRNQGRPGAIEGPKALRQALGKIPVLLNPSWRMWDVGDVTARGNDLEGAQQALALAVAQLLERRYLPIVLGGGHEVAWGHYQGICAAYPNSRIGIINFDAHYDLRPLFEGDRGSSGTSFLQIAQDRQTRGQRFDYLCIGIQRLGNTRAAHDTAAQLGTMVVPADMVRQDAKGRVIAQLDAFISSCDVVYVTLCMDVFAAAFAPGVSAPQPLGLSPPQLLPFLHYLAGSGKMVGFDVAEVAPPLDRDNQTVTLGAAIIAEVIHHLRAMPFRVGADADNDID